MSHSGFAISTKCSYYNRFALHRRPKGYVLIVSSCRQEEERRAELMARAKRKEEQWQWDEDTEEGKDNTSWSEISLYSRIAFKEKDSLVPRPSCLQH